MDGPGHDFEAIWDEVGPTLWRALFAYTGGRREIADDAVAEAFARVIERQHHIRDVRAYLFRVGFRIAAAEVRQDRRHEELADQVVEDAPGLGDLVRALRQLPPSQRAAIYLHYEADLPIREVASLMRTSSAVVKVHLMRGRRRLAGLLDESEDHDE